MFANYNDLQMTSKLDFKITVFSMPKMVQDKAILIVADQYKFVYDLSIGAIFRPIFNVNMSLPLGLQDKHSIQVYSGQLARSYTHLTNSVISNDLERH